MKEISLNVRTGMLIGKATIYGTPWSPHCKDQMVAFDAAHIPYDFVNCEQSQNKVRCKGIEEIPVVKGYPNSGDEWTGFKAL
jgi:hypothetical protein